MIRSSVKKSMVPKTRLPMHDREADARLQPAPARDRSARAALHLAQVGDEDQVAGLPGLAVEALAFAEPRLGGDAGEIPR